MPTSGGQGPERVSAADSRILEVVEAQALLEKKRGAPVTAAEMQEMLDVFVHHQRRLLPSFTPKFPRVLRLFAERLDHKPEALADEFNASLRDGAFISDSMPINLNEQLRDGFEVVAEYFEGEARTALPRVAESAAESALQARRVVATLGGGYVADDALQALQDIYAMMRSSDPAVRKSGRNLLNVIPSDEKGLLQFPFFMGELVGTPLTADELDKWRSRLQLMIHDHVTKQLQRLYIDPFYVTSAHSEIVRMVEALIFINDSASAHVIRSLQTLLSRGDVGLARDFVRLSIKFHGMPLQGYVHVLLDIAASAEETSFERGMLVRSVLHLIEAASTVSGAGLRLNILPLALTYLTGVGEHKREDNNLSHLLDRFLMPTSFLSEQETEHRYVTPYNVNDFEWSNASNMDVLVHHFLLNLVHEPHVTNSIASQLLEAAQHHKLSGARIWLMSKALYQDMLRGTKDYDQVKVNKYLAPLLDDDPKVQQLIDSARLKWSGPNDEFFRAYEEIVRARGGNGPGGKPGAAAQGPAASPAAPAEGQGASSSVVAGYSASPEAANWDTVSTPAPQWVASVPTTWVGNFGLNAAQFGAAAAMVGPVFEVAGRFAAAGL